MNKKQDRDQSFHDNLWHKTFRLIYKNLLLTFFSFLLISGSIYNIALSLDKPLSFTAEPSTYSKEIFSNWDDVSGASNYAVFKSRVPVSCSAAAPIDYTPYSSFTDSNVVPGIIYYYRVQAIGSNGEKSCSDLGSTYLEAEGPDDVQASDGQFSGKVRITWTGTGACIYHIYRSEDGYNGWKRVAVVHSQLGGAAQSCGDDFGRTRSWEDKTVTNGTTYWYRVEALKLYGGGTMVALWNYGEDDGSASGTGSTGTGTGTGDLPPLFVPPLKLEFMIKQTVGA